MMDNEIQLVQHQRFDLLERMYRTSLITPHPLEIVETQPIAAEMGIDENTLLRLLEDLRSAGYISFVSDGGFASVLLGQGKGKIETCYNQAGEQQMLLNKKNAKVTLIKKDGKRIEGIPAFVQPTLIIIDDATIPVEEEDIIERQLPSNLTERFHVVDRGFYQAMGSFPDHYQIKVRKLQSVPTSVTHNATHNTTYNVNGDNARVTHGDDNSRNAIIGNSSHQFADWRKVVDQSDADAADRDLILKKLSDLENHKDKKSALETLSSIATVATKYASLVSLIGKIGAWVHGLPA